jgi:hypothetical protein
LVEKNRALVPDQKVSTLTLDFELKRMADGWPALASGQVTPGGLVLKQARPIEPGLRAVPEDVRAQAFPRDLLGRARRVLEHQCAAGPIELTVWEAFTDPLRPPDMGYGERPFFASIELEATDDVSELGWSAGQRAWVSHLDIDLTDSRSLSAEEPWHFAAEIRGASTELEHVALTTRGVLEVQTSSAAAQLSLPDCEVRVAHASREDFLRALLDAGE